MAVTTINIDSQVLTFANLASFPITGTVKTIYIAEDTDIAYYWTGVTYQSISIQDVSGFQLKRIVVNSNITAVLDDAYTVVANATFTDPTPAEGKGFSVLIRNGTATIGGTPYSTVGTIVWRVFHSGSWANYVNVNIGAITGSGLTMATDRLLGRSTAGSGAVEEITIGSGLTLSAGTLTAAGGSGITIGTSAIASGTVNRILFEGAGNVVQQDSTFVWNNTDKRLILGTEAVADTNSRLVVIGKGTSTNTTFAVHNSTGTNNALVVTDDTKVGIGTNSPATRLHVVGASDERIRLSNGSNNIELVATSTNNTGLVFGSGLILRQNGASTQIAELVGVGTNPLTTLQIRGGTVGNVMFQIAGGGASNVSIFSLFRGTTETIRLVDNNLNDSYFNTTRSVVFGGTARSSASALVEMISTTQGFLPPRNANPAANITSPAEGLIAFDTTDKKLQVYDGTNWIDLH